jgi:hypothetical protein
MILQTPQQSLTKTRADFRIEEFRKLIQQKGIRLQWEQTVSCPCFLKSSTSVGMNLIEVQDIDANEAGPNPNCPACKGTGQIRHSAQEIKAIMTSSAGEETVEKFGLHRKERCKITLEPEHLPSYGDKFLLLDSVYVKREVVDIVAQGSATLRNPPQTRTLTLAGGQTDVNILHIYPSDANGIAQLNAEIPVSDITLNGDTITFNNAANSPPQGAKISVSYYHSPTFIAVGHPHTIRDTFVRTNQVEVPSPMPVQVECIMEID